MQSTPQAAVHAWGCKESDTTERLHFHFHALEKEMATHSSVLAWRIPGMGEPHGLPSMGSHRVRHDWSNLAAAATAAAETPQLKIPHSTFSIAFRPYNSFTHSCKLTISNYRNMVQTNFQITLKIILKPPFIQAQLRELFLARHFLELL